MASSTGVFLGSLSSLVDFFRRPLHPAPPVTHGRRIRDVKLLRADLFEELFDRHAKALRLDT